MKKLLMMIAVGAAILATGCSVKKIEYEKTDKGVSYRIYQNEHWLKTESTGIKGGMTNEGNFEFAAEGVKSSPSEEFNRTMQTYTTAFVQLAQIAAAAYNPSSSGVAAVRTADAEKAAQTVVNVQPAAVTSVTNASATAAADCTDCTVK